LPLWPSGRTVGPARAPGAVLRGRGAAATVPECAGRGNRRVEWGLPESDPHGLLMEATVCPDRASRAAHPRYVADRVEASL